MQLSLAGLRQQSYRNPVTNFLRPVLIFLGCLHVAIGPTNCLQLIAWGSMLVNYSEGRTLAEATEMTFNGDHPCSLCLSLSEERERGESQPLLPPEPPRERHELYPPRDTLPCEGLDRATLAGSAAPTILLADRRLISDPITPPPQNWV